MHYSFLGFLHNNLVSPFYSDFISPYIVSPATRLGIGLARAIYDPYRLARSNLRSDFILHTLTERAVNEGWSRASVPFSNQPVMVIGDKALAEAVFKAVDTLEGSRSPFYDSFQSMAGDLPFVLSSSGETGRSERALIKHFMFPSDLGDYHSAGQRLMTIYQSLFDSVDTALIEKGASTTIPGVVTDLKVLISSAILHMGIDMAYGPWNYLPGSIEELVKIASLMDKAVKLNVDNPNFISAKKAIDAYSKRFINKNIKNLKQHDTFAAKKAKQYLQHKYKLESFDDSIFESSSGDDIREAFYKTNSLMSLQALANISDIILTAYVEILKFEKRATGRGENSLIKTLRYIHEGFEKSDSDYRTVKLTELPLLMSIYNETLRFNVRVPNIARTCHEDITVNGINISSGTTIILPAYKNAHDPNTYKDPEEFNPYRFLSDTSEEKLPEFIFSAGDRRCPASTDMAPRLFMTAIRALCNHEVVLRGEPTLEPDAALYHRYPDPILCHVFKKRTEIDLDKVLVNSNREWLRQNRAGEQFDGPPDDIGAHEERKIDTKLKG